MLLFFFLHPSRDFTFVCPTEILAFNDALPLFKEIQTAVLGKPLSLYYLVSPHASMSV